jgi:hypothetical protein
LTKYFHYKKKSIKKKDTEKRGREYKGEVISRERKERKGGEVKKTRENKYYYHAHPIKRRLFKKSLK